MWVCIAVLWWWYHWSILHLQTGSTPLFIASETGHLPVVECLTAANADVNCLNKVGCLFTTASFPGCSQPQFWSLAVCKHGGGRPGRESHAWHHVDVSVDIRPLRGMMPNCCNSQTLHWSAPQIYWITSCIDAVFTVSSSWKDNTRRTSRLFIGHRLPQYAHVYSRVNLIACTRLSLRSTRSIFVYCKW